jgi:hypothetical protein
MNGSAESCVTAAANNATNNTPFNWPRIWPAGGTAIGVVKVVMVSSAIYRRPNPILDISI